MARPAPRPRGARWHGRRRVAITKGSRAATSSPVRHRVAFEGRAMHPAARAVPLFALLALTVAGPGRGADPESGLPALQRAVEQAVARAEPAVACVLVSRSEDYYRRLGERAPSPDTPGRLGKFAPAPAMPPVFRGRWRQPEENPDDALRRRLDLSNPDNTPESFGSGVVIDPAGLVLTCAHVVRNATKVFVRLPGGKESWADIHASDPRSDLAVLRL